jgi:putative colanic acid biosynthesis UDP-glucose lipid carrier transferase
MGGKVQKNHRGMIRPFSATLVELNRVLDAVWIVSALWLSSHLVDAHWTRTALLVSLITTVIFTFVANHWHLYRSWRMDPLRDELFSIWQCWALTIMIVAFLSYVSAPHLTLFPPMFLAWALLAPAVLTLTRILIRMTLRSLRWHGRNYRRTAIVGATEIGQRVEHIISNTHWMGLRNIGFFDDRTPDGERMRTSGIALQGSIDELERLARAGEVDLIYIALPMRAELRIRELLQRFNDTTVSVHFVPDFTGFDLLHACWGMLGNLPVVSIVDTPIQGFDAMLKRSMDLLVSLLVILLAGIPMLLIAVAIKLSSPGPVIFHQRRYGLDGKEFVIWKFRTMAVYDDRGEYRQATRNDPRVTPLGRFLRRTSLDELPQFFNVFQGRMSVVGPRPHPVALNEQHRLLIDRYMLRHKVRPGITGWAQVNGCRGETDTPEKMHQRIAYDLEYIDNWSLWLDIRILFMTLGKGFVGANAY